MRSRRSRRKHSACIVLTQRYNIKLLQKKTNILIILHVCILHTKMQVLQQYNTKMQVIFQHTLNINCSALNLTMSINFNNFEFKNRWLVCSWYPAWFTLLIALLCNVQIFCKAPHSRTYMVKQVCSTEFSVFWFKMHLVLLDIYTDCTWYSAFIYHYISELPPWPW